MMLSAISLFYSLSNFEAMIIYFLQFVPATKRVAQMARLRLEYDEARKRRIDLQKKLAYLEDNQSSGLDNSAMCDHDRLV